MGLVRRLYSNPVLNNIAWLLFEKGITVLLIFWSEGLIAKSLSVQQYGQWVYSLNLVILISSIALISGAEVAVPVLSRNKKIKNELISSIFIIRFSFALLAFIFCIVYAVFIVKDKAVSHFLIILSFMLIFNEPFSVIINHYQSLVKIKSIIFLRIFSLFIRCAVVFLVYKLSLSIYDIAFSRVAEMLVLACLLLYLAIKNNFSFVLDYAVLKIVFIRGLYLWPSLILMYVYLRMDRFFVEHYLSFTGLAIYGIAVQLMEQLFVLIKMVIQSASPVYIYPKQAYVKLKKNMLRMILLMLVLTILISIPAYYLLVTMVNFVFGSKYSDAALVTVHMLPAILFFSIDSVFMQYIYRQKMMRALIIKWIMALIISASSYYIYFGILKKSDPAIIYISNYFAMMLITISIVVIGVRRDRK